MRTSCLLLVVIILAIILQAKTEAINEKLLNEANLEIVWQNAVALKPAAKKVAKETVERITILGDYIYILTDTNYLFCLDRIAGNLVFGISAAEPKLPVSEPVDYNNVVYMVAGNEMLAMDLKTGQEVYRKDISFHVTLRPAVNAMNFYFAGSDKFLHVTNTALHQVFEVSSKDRSDITGVISNDKSIFFTTQGGSVLCMDANGPKKNWQFDTVGPIEAPLVKDSNSIYVSCKDTNLYKLSADRGELKWKFRTGSFLTTPVRATAMTIYQYARNKGLYAIDANSGKQLWLLPEGIDLLAQKGNKAYVFDKNKMCDVMDNASGKKLYSVNFVSVTNFAANSYDTKMYIMEDKNIICIQPIRK